MSEPSNHEPLNGEPGDRRRGPPPGSANAARHFLKGGKLPSHLSFVENRVNAFRRHVEAMVIEKKGEISLADAASINSATKWERHGCLAQYWLRLAEDESGKMRGKKPTTPMSYADRLKFSEAVAKASDNRDKNLRLLGLETVQLAPWVITQEPKR